MRSKRSKAVAGATAVVMLLTANVALADSLEGDELTNIRQSGSLNLGTVCAGESASGTLHLAIRRQGGGAQTYANGAIVTVNPLSTTTGLTAGDASGSITIPQNWEGVANGSLSPSVTATVNLVTNAVGSFAGSVTYRSSGLNSASNVRTFDDIIPVTATVVDCAPADTTPPVITADVVGNQGSNGWYTSDVDLTWSVTDAESAISTSTGCDAVSITADQSATTYTCSATSAGGNDAKSVTIKRDATAPVITPGDVADTTWRNSSLSQAFTATDAGSGLADAVDASFNLTASNESADASTPTTATKTVTDAAGNTTTRTLSARIDRTAPTSVISGVTEGAVYGVAPTVTCAASDGLSGVASHGMVSGDSTTAGVKTVSCNGAVDVAGNVQTVASSSVSYTLAPIGGFNSNFDGGAVLRVKPNQAIPLKWAFNDGTANSALLSGASVSSVPVNCSTAERIDGTEVAEVAAGASGLQLLTDGSYQMNWKATSSTGCRALTVTMTFKDGGSTTKTILVNIAK